MSNNLNALRNLIAPDAPLRVGTSSGPNGDGTINVTTLDGGVIRVVGTAPYGARVFVQGGEQRGLAPALTEVVVDV